MGSLHNRVKRFYSKKNVNTKAKSLHSPQMAYSVYLGKNPLWEEGAGAKLLLYACGKRAGSLGR